MAAITSNPAGLLGAPAPSRWTAPRASRSTPPPRTRHPGRTQSTRNRKAGPTTCALGVRFAARGGGWWLLAATGPQPRERTAAKRLAGKKNNGAPPPPRAGGGGGGGGG